MASFKNLNLMADFSPWDKFDVIFCRNVAIYFTERDRISLFGAWSGRWSRRLPGDRRHGIAERNLPAVRIQAASALGVLPVEDGSRR